MSTPKRCVPCGMGAHNLCLENDRHRDCRCAKCHPPQDWEESVTEAFYTLAYALYGTRPKGGDFHKETVDQVFHAVNVQFREAPIEEWVKVSDIARAILAEGSKNYYSRSEVADALTKAGFDVVAYKDVPFKAVA